MIAEYLGIGKTQLYELSLQLYGCGIAEHIRDLRMEKAKTFLRESKDLALSEIALAADMTTITTSSRCLTGRWALLPALIEKRTP